MIYLHNLNQSKVQKQALSHLFLTRILCKRSQHKVKSKPYTTCYQNDFCVIAMEQSEQCYKLSFKVFQTSFKAGWERANQFGISIRSVVMMVD